MSKRNIVVEELSRGSIESQEVEMCEHKGIGHPDTMTDAVCEAASKALSKEYLKYFGRVLHHNVDKGLLVAGSSNPKFGGGQFEDKIKLIICGRATASLGYLSLDVKSICLDAASNWLKKNIRLNLGDIELVAELKEGSGNLKEVFSRANGVSLANDTSFGVGFAPFSKLEQSVLDTAKLLNSKSFLANFPSVGDDFKVMGLRKDDKIHLTICIAFIDKFITNPAQYFELKEKVKLEIEKTISGNVIVDINTLDDEKTTSVDGMFLTVSGLSAEMGDDGQVGRGNRVNGLITPTRVTSLEAPAGKNPTSHVGKIYNVLATLIAKDLHEKIDEVQEVYVKLLSAIGRPVDEPQVASVEVLVKNELTQKLKDRIESIVDTWLLNVKDVSKLIIDGEVGVF